MGVLYVEGNDTDGKITSDDNRSMCDARAPMPEPECQHPADRCVHGPPSSEMTPSSHRLLAGFIRYLVKLARTVAMVDQLWSVDVPGAVGLEWASSGSYDDHFKDGLACGRGRQRRTTTGS